MYLRNMPSVSKIRQVYLRNIPSVSNNVKSVSMESVTFLLEYWMMYGLILLLPTWLNFKCNEQLGLMISINTEF